MNLLSWPANRALRSSQRAAAAVLFSHRSDDFLASAASAAQPERGNRLLERQAARRR